MHCRARRGSYSLWEFLRDVGRLWNSHGGEVGLGLVMKGPQGTRRANAGASPNPLPLLPPQGLVVAILYCFLNGEVSVLGLLCCPGSSLVIGLWFRRATWKVAGGAGYGVNWGDQRFSWLKSVFQESELT